MDIKESQKELSKAFKKKVASITFERAHRNIENSRVELTFPDRTRAVLAYATVKRDLPKGQFAVYSLVSVADGPIYRVMTETQLDKSNSFYGDGLLRGTSHNLLDPGDYYVRNEKDGEKVADQIVADMHKVYVPIVRAFTADYQKAFEFIVSNKGKYVRNPFTLAVILLGFMGSFDKLAKLIAEAQKQDGFYDFRKAEDPQRQIGAPIVEWFNSNMR